MFTLLDNKVVLSTKSVYNLGINCRILPFLSMQIKCLDLQTWIRNKVALLLIDNLINEEENYL